MITLKEGKEMLLDTTAKALENLICKVIFKRKQNFSVKKSRSKEAEITYLKGPSH